MGSWVRYTHNKEQKAIVLMGNDYIFPRNKWIYIKFSVLLRKVFEHQDIFEVADFDIQMIKGIPGIRCHGKLIQTSDTEAIKELNARPWFAKKYSDKNRHVFLVCMSDSRFKLLSLLEKQKGTIGIYRMKGGWGDVVMAHFTACSLKKKYPKLNVIFSCPGEFRDLVDTEKDVKWVEIHAFLAAKYDTYIDLTSPCIRHERTFQPKIQLNRPEIFAQECMLPVEDLKPHALVKPEALKWAKEFLKDKPRPWIGFVPQSCAPIRNWWGWEEVAKSCIDNLKSTNLVFNSGRIVWAEKNGNVPVVAQTMSKVAALLSLCDIVVGVDTGPMHTASALGKETVWVFTHIDGAVRTKGYKNAIVVQKKDSCERCPCWYSSLCSDGRQAACGKAIKIKHVTTEIDKVLGKKHGNIQCQ